MNSMAPPEPVNKVIVGVDTHKYVHVAVVLSGALRPRSRSHRRIDRR